MQNVKVTHKGKKGPVPARLFMIFARKSPMTVIFRRGPSKWVQLVKWNTTRLMLLRPGKWFNGRIYERWSDSTYALWGQCFAVIAMCSGSLTALMHCPARAG